MESKFPVCNITIEVDQGILVSKFIDEWATFLKATNLVYHDHYRWSEAFRRWLEIQVNRKLQINDQDKTFIVYCDSDEDAVEFKLKWL